MVFFFAGFALGAAVIMGAVDFADERRVSINAIGTILCGILLLTVALLK